MAERSRAREPLLRGTFLSLVARYDPETGWTYDGINIDPVTGRVSSALDAPRVRVARRQKSAAPSLLFYNGALHSGELVVAAGRKALLAPNEQRRGFHCGEQGGAAAIPPCPVRPWRVRQERRLAVPSLSRLVSQPKSSFSARSGSFIHVVQPFPFRSRRWPSEADRQLCIVRLANACPQTQPEK